MTRHQRVNPFSTAALRFHVPLVIGVVGCFFAGRFELYRALGGHTIAWVYAFEWPGFAIAGVFIWWRIITNRDDQRPGAPGSDRPGRDLPADDPGLIAWQEYLADTRRRDGAHDIDATD